MIVRLDNEPDIIEKTENDLNLDSEKDESKIKKEEKLNDSQKETTEKTEGVE